MSEVDALSDTLDNLQAGGGGESSAADPNAEPAVESEVTTDSGVGEGDAPDPFDWSAYADNVVTIKVDGEEVRVPLREALAGYSRQADYTRKTQELSAERERLGRLDALEKALEADPRATLAALSEVYGITSAEVEQDDLDPLEARLRKAEAFMAEQEAERKRAAVTADARAAIEATRLTDVNEEQLLRFAVDNQVGDLRSAARLMAFERADQVRQQERERAASSKRSDAVVEGGGSTAAARAGTSPAIRTLQDAFEAAKRSHGVSDVGSLLGGH